MMELDVHSEGCGCHPSVGCNEFFG